MLFYDLIYGSDLVTTIINYVHIILDIQIEPSNPKNKTKKTYDYMKGIFFRLLHLYTVIIILYT